MALIQDRNTETREARVMVLPVAAAKKIYAGALVAADANGFVTPGAVATTLTYLGRAEEQVDNSAGANGDKTLQVRMGAAFKFKNSGGDPVTQAELGKTVYIEDDETVAKTNGTGTRSAAGKVVGVESDGVWVL